jgi:hypothetical protein
LHFSCQEEFLLAGWLVAGNTWVVRQEQNTMESATGLQQQNKDHDMRYWLALSLLVLGGSFAMQQQARSEYKLGFRPGFNISWEGGNNAVLGGLVTGQPIKEHKEDWETGAGYSPYPSGYAASPASYYPRAPYYGGAPTPSGYAPNVAQMPRVPVYPVSYTPYGPLMTIPYPYYPTSTPNYYYNGGR